MAGDDQRLTLRDLERCLRGAVPATIATCSPEGIPNITYLSIVHQVDDTHIALSFQFFNKTRANILAHPEAQLLVPDPVTLEQYRLDVHYERTEQEGEIFERMRTNLDAVASQTGMAEIFRLQGADIYRVLRVEKLARDLDLRSDGSPDRLAALEDVQARLTGCDELESLLDTALVGLAECFDLPCSMILFVDETGTRLYAVATHGFAQSGVGAELAVGEGLIGTAASQRRPVRVANLQNVQVMAAAVREEARRRGHGVEPAREIALPGLPDVSSQIAVPMLARDHLLGVLCVQSPEPGRLTTADERALGALARYLAASIRLLGQPAGAEPSVARAYAGPPGGEGAMRIRHHASDDSVFIDDEYVIKGVPGRILSWLLNACRRDGRVDFTNKELRVDDGLRLGTGRDNLEARLILLRRRLEERGGSLRLVKTGRGRFRLQLDRGFQLTHAP